VDRSAVGRLPGGLELQKTIEQARPRPVTPAYAFVSEAIYRNVHAALRGRVSPKQALRRADREIERALDASG
jgi:multiple sugar transport system substrate-binding protein